MDAIILAAGQGVRLRPITEKTPKGLIPINGVTLLDNLAKKIAELKVDSVHLITNKYFFHHYQIWKKKYTGPLNIQIIQQRIAPGKKKGTMRTIQYIIKHEKLKNDIFVCGIDNFFDFSLVPAQKLFFQKKNPVLISHDTHDREIATQHSLIKYHPDTNRITHFFIKSALPRNTLCMTFLLFFPNNITKYINKYINEGKNTDNVGHFLERLKKSIPLYTYEPKHKKRFDIGNYYSLYKTKKAFGEKKVTLERLQKGIIR